MAKNLFAPHDRVAPPSPTTNQSMHLLRQCEDIDFVTFVLKKENARKSDVIP